MQLWNHAIARILERMEDTRKRVGNNYPHWCDYETGKWTTTVDGDWTGGFWPGIHGFPAGGRGGIGSARGWSGNSRAAEVLVM